MLHHLQIKFDALPDDQRKEALRKLLLAAALRKMANDVFKEFAMSMTQLEQDPFFGKLLGKAEAKGLAIGEAKGRAEGWRDGLRAGRVAALMAILKTRGWAVADHVLAAARSADADTVERMTAAAITIRTVDEFKELFGIAPSDDETGPDGGEHT